VVNGHKSAAHTDSPDGGTTRRALAEVCNVPVLLVLNVFSTEFRHSRDIRLHYRLTFANVYAVVIT